MACLELFLTSAAFLSATSSFSWASFRASEYLSSSSSVPFSFFCICRSSSSCWWCGRSNTELKEHTQCSDFNALEYNNFYALQVKVWQKVSKVNRKTIQFFMKMFLLVEDYFSCSYWPLGLFFPDMLPLKETGDKITVCTLNLILKRQS